MKITKNKPEANPEKPKKVLGKSSYKNSKQKQKVQQKKRTEDKKIISKDRQIKVKIKHLQKELARINKNPDPKNSTEKLVIEKKIAQLSLLNKNFNKKPTDPKKSKS